MRAVFIFVLIASVIRASAPANAADLTPGYSRSDRSQLGRYNPRYYALTRRENPLVVYDYEPGVVVRAYWIAPWRNRHYFPTTGNAPELGRLEDLSAPRETPEQAENFQRNWSTSSEFANEDLSARPILAAPEQRGEQFPQTSEPVKP
jgi:hypothetical protein